MSNIAKNISNVSNTFTQTNTFTNDILFNGVNGTAGAGIAYITVQGTNGAFINYPGGGNIRFAAISNGLQIKDMSNNVFQNFDGDATRAVRFPANVGFNFSTTLAPVINTQTVDWSTGCSQIISAASTTATLVLSFTNPVAGGRYVVETIGKTGRAWTFTGVKWAGGVAPTVTAVDNAKDMFELYYDGVVHVGRIIAQNVS